jgi:riboflavin kinase/FMN adenylyltransferase
MNIYHSLNEVPDFKNAVVTIGSFDGVHFAHKKLINRINQIANEINGDAVVVTFHPHPRSIVFPNDKSLVLLSTIEEKIELFRKSGVKHLIVIPFTVEFAQLSANEYVEKFLIKALKTKYLVVGYDHKFGLARRGDFQLLQMYEKEGSFKLIEIEKQEIDEIAISSTNIRKAIANSDMDQANGLLGGHYYIRGRVVKGDGIGKTIGYPTANIEVNGKDKLIPPVGIYACFVTVANHRFKGMLYIGNRPTINAEGKPVVEVNILDFNDNIYDEYIGLEIVKFLRSDQKFDGLEGLKNQLDLDRINADQVLTAYLAEVPYHALATISILNYNGKSLLETYLPSLEKSSDRYDVKIQVVDNKSTDDSLTFLKKHYPTVEVVALNSNYGYAGGYNKGNVDIRSKYTVLVNSDIRGTEGWLDPIIELMEADDNIATVQPKIKSINEDQQYEYAGASGGFIDTLAYPFCRGRIFDTVEEDAGQYDDTREVFWTSGAAMVVRTEVFKLAGGFDDDFFAHQEEIDLCWRLKRAGYKCMVCPSSVVYHLGGGTLQYDNPHKTYLNFRNNLTMLLKNEYFPKVLLTFIMRLVLDGIAAIKYLGSGKPANVWSILRAHFALYAALPHIVHKRNTHNVFISNHRVGKANDAGKMPYSILMKYYLGGKKTFASLESK